MNITGNATSGWTAGRFGKGLMFDGADDYVDAGNGASLNITTGEFTISFWLASTYQSLAGIIAKKDDVFTVENKGWGFEYAFNPQKLYIGISNGTSDIEYSTNLDTFTWRNLGLMRTSSNQIYFINNGAITLMGTLSGDISNTLNLEIGRITRSGEKYLNGFIDEVRIWSKALTPDETVAMKQII